MEKHRTAGYEKSSSSCPAEVDAYHGGRVRDEAPLFMSNNEAQVWAKERVKKDNHNISERPHALARARFVFERFSG